MRRIDAPRAEYEWPAMGESRVTLLPGEEVFVSGKCPVRIVRESDYLKLMHFARLAESYILEGEFAPRVTYRRRALAALDALNAKPKEQET